MLSPLYEEKTTPMSSFILTTTDLLNAFTLDFAFLVSLGVGHVG